MGSRVFTSSENVKTDDTKLDANEQMMRSVGGEKGRREERKRKFSQCQMEEQLAALSLRWGWIFLYGTNTHTYNHTNKHTYTHAELPPVTSHHLPSTWSSKQDQGGLLSFEENEEIRAKEGGVERH